MIKVVPKTEPINFDADVRKPGQQFLTKNPAPKGKQWHNHEYWRDVLHQLHSAYSGICAYSCHWIPFDTGARTVEHFKPKDVFPYQAYEWNNYRLVCGTLNGRKGIAEDVLDPFDVETGWFVLDFPSLIIRPSEDLEETIVKKVMATITRLKLNDEGTCLKSRFDWIIYYCQNEFTFQYLQKKAPFLAGELERQSLILTIRDIMKL